MDTDEPVPQQCGSCEDGARAAVMTRRGLLRSASLAAAVTATSGVSTRIAYAARPKTYTGDTLVVLSLRGGFDGLSAVAPVNDPHYHAARPNIGVSARSALRLDSLFGLHPALAPLKPLYDAGTFGVVHATGMSNPNRSHFSAMAHMEQAAPGTSLRTGWLDRSLALHSSTGPFGAVHLGSTAASPAFTGPGNELALERLDRLRLSGADTPEERARWTRALGSLYAGAPTAAASAARGAVTALLQGSALPPYTPANGARYPDSRLGRALSDLARLIRAGAGVRVATVDEGDWDMHAGSGRVDGGWMRDKLADLAASLAAFARDLGPHFKRVSLVTMSEFGRRTLENSSGGTDHGWGNAMLLLGGGVVGGRVHGTWPGLAPESLVQGDLRATTDYRAILADLLRNRCGASTSAVREVFPQWSGTALGIARPR